MIPGNGVYRVRRRRFEEARSADSTIGGSTIGVSIIRLVGIAALSTSFSMFFEVGQHYRNITTNGRREARAGRRGTCFIIGGLDNLFLYLLHNRRIS